MSTPPPPNNWFLLSSRALARPSGNAQRTLIRGALANQPGHPDHDAMMRELTGLFENYKTGGHVTLEYETEVYLGRVEE